MVMIVKCLLVINMKLTDAWYQASTAVWNHQSSGMLHIVDFTYLPTFRDNLTVEFSKIKQSKKFFLDCLIFEDTPR